MKECFGRFDIKEDCRKCEEKEACLITVIKENPSCEEKLNAKEPCFTENFSCHLFKKHKEDFLSFEPSKKATLMVLACKAIRDVRREREVIQKGLNACEHFGKMSKLENYSPCLSCPKEIFEACEAEEVKMKDFPQEKEEELSFTVLQTKTKIKEQASDLLKETIAEGGCFGEFEFEEEECLTACEFKIRCLRMTGIGPPKIFGKLEEMECKHKPEIGKDRILLPPRRICCKCQFTEQCFPFFERIRSEQIKALEERKVYRKVFSLCEIREILSR